MFFIDDAVFPCYDRVCYMAEGVDVSQLPQDEVNEINLFPRCEFTTRLNDLGEHEFVSAPVTKAYVEAMDRMPWSDPVNICQRYILLYLGELLVGWERPYHEVKEIVGRGDEESHDILEEMREHRRVTSYKVVVTDEVHYLELFGLVFDNMPMGPFMDGKVTRVLMSSLDHTGFNYQILLMNVIMQPVGIREKMLKEWVPEMNRGLLSGKVDEERMRFLDFQRVSFDVVSVLDFIQDPDGTRMLQ